jgi:hypothetical protein
VPECTCTFEQFPRLDGLVEFVADQRLQIGLGDGLLLVGQFLEAVEDLLELFLVQW